MEWCALHQGSSGILMLFGKVKGEARCPEESRRIDLGGRLRGPAVPRSIELDLPVLGARLVPELRGLPDRTRTFMGEESRRARLGPLDLLLGFFSARQGTSPTPEYRIF